MSLQIVKCPRCKKDMLLDRNGEISIEYKFDFTVNDFLQILARKIRNERQNLR